jgi:hypothetical protein
MPDPGDIGRRISDNESFLSGMVALIVLASGVLSPMGKGLRGVPGELQFCCVLR